SGAGGCVDTVVYTDDSFTAVLAPPEKVVGVTSRPADPVELPGDENIPLGRWGVCEPRPYAGAIKRSYRTGHPDVFGAADNLATVTVSPPGNTLVLPLDAGRGVRSLAQPERLKYAKGHAATIQGLSGLWTYICV